MNYRKICLLVAVIAFVVAPFGAEADQISPNPNPVGNTIVVGYYADAVNTEDFINNGLLYLRDSSTLTNSGTLTNNSGGSLQIGSFEDQRVTMANSGTLNNWGLIETDSGNLLDNSGTLNNWGTLYGAHGGGRGGRIYNSGMLINSSTLSAAILQNKVNGTIVNSGEMYSTYLTNSGTLTNNYYISGYYGNLGGALMLTNSGTLTNNGGISSWDGGFTNTGTLTNNGRLYIYQWAQVTNSGKLTNNGSITCLDIGQVGPLSGTYTQTAGQTVNNGSLTQASIDIQGGSLSGTGTITANSVNIGTGASLHPGNSPGTLTINGTFSSSGNLFFDIAGTASGQYSLLQINGAATFSGGRIEFDFINGFSASAGNSWDFLFADSITGWDTLGFTLSGLGNGLRWEVDPFLNGERLLITAAPVPIPPTFILLGSGLLGLAGWRKIRKS